MNWIDISSEMMLNLDIIRAISKEDESSSRIFVSDKDNFIVPIQYKTLSSLIRMKIKNGNDKTLRSIMLGQTTPRP